MEMQHVALKASMDQCSFKDEEQKETERPIRGQKPERPEGQEGQKGQEGQEGQEGQGPRAPRRPKGQEGQMTPREQAAGVKALQRRIEQTTHTAARKGLATGHGAQFRANF